MFKLKTCPPDFAEAPPFSFDHDLLLDGTPEQVFDVVAHIEHEAEWFPDFRTARWLTEPGAGAVRDYRLTYMRLLEHFTVWERGQRLQFWVSRWSIPMLARFLEDYRFEAAGVGRTRMRWRIAYEPLWFLRPLHGIVRRVFARDFHRATHQLQAYCRQLYAAGTEHGHPEGGALRAPLEARGRGNTEKKNRSPTGSAQS